MSVCVLSTAGDSNRILNWVFVVCVSVLYKLQLLQNTLSRVQLNKPYYKDLYLYIRNYYMIQFTLYKYVVSVKTTSVFSLRGWLFCFVLYIILQYQ